MANRMISYGYGMEGGKLVVIDSEAEIVRRVFREYIEGKLLQEIAYELTEEEVKSGTLQPGILMLPKSRLDQFPGKEAHLVGKYAILIL